MEGIRSTVLQVQVDKFYLRAYLHYIMAVTAVLFYLSGTVVISTWYYMELIDGASGNMQMINEDSLYGEFWSLEGGFDLNNDGFGDFLVGNGDNSNQYRGVLAAYFGGAEFDTIPDYIVPGTVPHAYFGKTIASLGDINNDGNPDFAIGEELSGRGRVSIYSFGDFTSIDNHDKPSNPKTFIVEPAYPNPFNPATTIRYTIPEKSRVKVTIYDQLGREVKTLMNRNQAAGEYSLTWNGTNNHEQPLGSGLYFCQVKTGDSLKTIKLVLMK